ncbi:Uma2 family endonuclease [Luteitalea sp.]|uniref:Uma2 family endonuclease n=1 Tax=Luteitalea sp. TaxID=2004800 RepID=UPI0025C669A2|nr:Uma2 family endonuclease [Luteitalea sp.]
MRSPAARADMRLTYDDFVLFPDDGKRHEIIDGEHYVTPAPNVRHQRLVGRLLYEIERYLRANPHAGEVFAAPLDVVLSHFDVVEPDLLFVAGDQTDILTEKNVQGPPALVIEVLSKSTRKRDAQTKRRLFERTGVREYWLVDPELDAVQVFRPTAEGRLARVAELTAEDGGVVTTPLLPGCQIDLRELFRAHI